MVAAKLVLESSNSKLGNVAATYASIDGSCPKSCALKDNGCYAQLAFVGIHVSRLNKDAIDARSTARDEARAIREAIKLEKNVRPLRLHVAGDCRTDEAAKILSAATKDWNNPVWTYTHAWKDVKRNSWGKHISVLASVDNAKDLKRAKSRGYAAAVVVDKFPNKKAFDFHGFKAIPCPNQTHENVTCESCKLCTRDSFLKEANTIIAFEAHGSMKRKLPVVK
jgi:hypothetical protein